MSRRQSLILVLVASALLATACGGGGAFPDGSFAVVANLDIGPGDSRVQVGVVAEDGARLGGPDVPIELELSPADGSSDPVVYPAEWMWLIEGVFGLYRVDARIPTPGVWNVRVIPDRGRTLPVTQFQVFEETFAPSVGDAAPVAPLDTLDTRPIEDLTTDHDPDPDFYRLTMEEAFNSGRKTVVVFSTPAFCETAVCGPTLDIVKSVKPEFPNVNFMHVEVYRDINDPDFALTAEFLHPSLGPDYWNLPTEPWVFVVDETGTVTARYEGSLTQDDLRGALG